MTPTPPTPYYYLHNFQRALDWVTQRYADLLIDEEREFVSQFTALPQASQALLVRMVMRKGEYFKSSKLRYDEIGCPDHAAPALIKQGWLIADPVMDIDALFNLLTKSELTGLFQHCGKNSALKKADLLAALRMEFSEPQAYSAWNAASAEQVYKIQITDLCERLRLLFFGNLYQSWSEFVLSDLGIYRYEPVEFSTASRGFSSRQDLEDYLHLHRCRSRFNDGELLDEIVAAIPPVPLANDWIESRRSKLLFRIAYQYERCAEFASALQIYQRCSYPGARLRTIRVLERSNECERALALASTAWARPESEAEHQSLLRILPRLLKKNGLDKASPVARAELERIDLVLAAPELPASVESVVCSHFSAADAPVHYVENTLLNSLFGLLCWPAIFAPLPGAFFHPFHHGPADLHSPDFYPRRQQLFSDCLAQLDSGLYRDTIISTFKTKYGIQSPFVYWNHLDEGFLKLALSCLPASHLKKFFQRMLQDIPSNRSGLPDLIQFWPHEQRYRMLEVKGPGDRLQDNQIRWLDYCVANDIPVAVCYVQWEAGVAA